MRTKISFGLMLAVAVLAIIVTISHPWNRPGNQNPEQPPQPEVQAFSEAPSEAPASSNPEPIHKSAVSPSTVVESPTVPSATAELPSGTNKLERLNKIRETFVALAAGNPTNALRAAKSLTDGNERETALLALVTQWTQGRLSLPQDRAYYVSKYGFEAGLGVELANNPELAVLWADELTEGAGRAAVLRRTAVALVGSDPSAAFALGQQLPAEEQRSFLDAVFAGWGASDTEAALKYADQLQDPAEHNAAINAIRSTAPVGIGAELKSQDGYTVINGLIPGTPAELSGQIHAGDRIVALAQGDNAFVDARGVPLNDIVNMIRGQPNTVLQLQLLAADAGPDATPRIVSILRDQLKFKRTN